MARQLRKKFEPYLHRRTDTNQLLLHILKKIVEDKATYYKIVHGVEELERVEVSVALDQFEHEARDFTSTNLTEFFKSQAFQKEYAIEGRFIKATTKI